MKRNYFFLSIISIVVIGTIPFMGSKRNADEVGYVYNEQLRTVNDLPEWKGTPKGSDGKFRNLYQPFDSRFSDLLKWKLSPNPQREAKKSDNRKLSVEAAHELIKDTGDYLIWLGHASFLMKKQGVTFLIDPILIDNFFLKRQSEMPLSLSELPEIDYLLVSHNHRDHCDQSTVEYLASQNPKMVVLTGLGIGEVLRPWLESHKIQEAGWFQQYDLPDASIQVVYVPTRHWSRRGLMDENESLWGGFFFRFADTSVYFMGDSGYGPHFRDIQAVMGSPEYALMGVGAFKPEWFMHQSHISPTDAIRVFNELGAGHFFPMHFGTFDLSDEPLMEPLDILLENEDKISGKLIFPTIGKNIW
ncbi:MAG: MBL fold metallo-hydrolase [Lunatimonas sp.]|uniref:MBL fold metallo-hydrolase n=1 Tax=Lunatimonas sp. TaxID=2060141 RepID=UPI00263BAEB7|nr:MBL fold metallo-hydrolase [Lunatimonas sp.]MCC5937279.1 MBL fold metallo-hydrolase [Lunatimonas sp.]